MNDYKGRSGSGPGVPGSGGQNQNSGAEFMGVGLQFGLSIVAFMFLGMWLDTRLGTSPWLLILGVFVGAAGGFYSIYRKLMDAQEREEKEARRK